MSIYSINYLFKNSKLNPESLPKDFLDACDAGHEHSLIILRKVNIPQEYKKNEANGIKIIQNSFNSIPADKKEIIINCLELFQNAFNSMRESATATVNKNDILLTFFVDTDNQFFKTIQKVHKNNFIEEVAEQLSMRLNLGINLQIQKEIIANNPYSISLETIQNEFEILLKNQYKPGKKLFFIEKEK